MYNIHTEGTEDQSGIYLIGEYLGNNLHMRRSECIRKYPHRYNPHFGASRKWNNNTVESIVYMIQDEDLNRDVDIDEILLLLAEWYS